jgi:8-oxo-dGTP pyrophosphatase MutT (NUDIX family)
VSGGRPLQKVRIAVVRGAPAAREVLLLLHPATAPQLPGGGVEAGESLAAAARREVAEETGLAPAEAGRFLEPFEMLVPGGPQGDGPFETQRWHTWVVEAPPDVPDAWQHRVRGTGVDRDHVVAFGWARLDAHLPARVHPRFRPLVERLLGSAT